MKKTYLIKTDHIPLKAAFPVIDAHNHLWGDWQVEKVLRTMDETGIACYCDLTSNVHIEFSGGGYVIKSGNIHDFFNNCVLRYPNRFYGFTLANFAHPVDEPLFDNADEFVEKCIQTLNEHVTAGAKGLKILKELGLDN